MSHHRRRGLALALAAGAALLAAPHVQAADQAPSGAREGPDMRILTTPQDVLFRVQLGEIGRRFQPVPVEGAMGWSVRLCMTKTGEDHTWPLPATDGERVFVGGPLSYSEFYALRADDGRLAWKTSLGDNGPTPPVVRDRRVYFNTQSCTLYAYDTRNGSKLWSRYLAGTLESIPALAGEEIVTTRPSRHGVPAKNGGNLPALTVLDLAGRVQNDIDIDGEALGAPILHDGKAYLATRAGTLYCVDLDEGETQWARRCNARGAPWVDDTGIYVATKDALAAYTPKTGIERWTEVAITPSSRTRDIPTTTRPPALRVQKANAAKTDAFWREGMRPVAVDDMLCIAEGRTLRMFHRVTGAETAWWEIDVDGNFVGAPIITGSTVVVATREGQIRAIDARHGEIVWAVDIDRPLGSGVIVDDGKVYAVTRDGRLVCVHTGDLRADGWPMWGGTPEHSR
jgi:outer membrane protein assembly factor BamB